MSQTSTGPAGGRYIIHAVGDSNLSALADFISSLGAEPGVKLLEAIGPREHPHTVVVETTQAVADTLGQRFRRTNQLMIEPDQPLSMFAQRTAPSA